jgi:hypothetical protein
MEQGDQSIAAKVSSLDPKSLEFSEVAKTVAEKTQDIRTQDGKVPYELFIAGLEMAGVYPAMELLITDKIGNIYLKRRSREENQSNAEDSAWEGKLHIPGAAIAPAKRFELNFYDFLNKEIVKVGDDSEKRQTTASLYKQSETIGVYMSPEPARKTNAFTLLLRIVIDRPEILQDGFEIVNTDNLSEVIDQHKPIVERLLQKSNIPFILDVRGKTRF